GGFNSNKHPIFIESAIHTSRRIHAQAEGLIEGTTEVYLLGESIFGIMERKINSAITKMERNN
ncbi:MAG: hypothetical protein KDC84_16285, partial [Crocinitomicaceae bacterium]|nr:hypothetical protein [Crocinitomicaceae bacterium]